MRVADQPLAVRVEKGREVYTPVEDGAAAAVRPGRAYLVTDKGERKATGSYYTPDYIVKYIVSRTVQPVLDELRARHEADPEGLAAAILAVNILDPSMGAPRGAV